MLYYTWKDVEEYVILYLLENHLVIHIRLMYYVDDVQVGILLNHLRFLDVLVANLNYELDHQSRQQSKDY